MPPYLDRRWAVAALGLALAGCASLPQERGSSEVDRMMSAREVPSPAWRADRAAAASVDARVAELLTQPLTPEQAVQVAFLKNPRIQMEYARLGLSQADLFDASRVSNPTLGYVDLSARGPEGSQVTRSISTSFADILLLRARTRLARTEVERVRSNVAAALIELATEVETAWYEYVTAQQVAGMRDAVAQATALSAEFAQRSYEAGNITPRDLALEQATASEARILATRAAAEVIRARTTLAGVLAVPARDRWETLDKLPAPPAEDAAQNELIQYALSERQDLAAARREVNLFEDALGVTRRWRWLGDFDVGYERESETDGARVRGPSLAVQIPLFNQGQGRVLRAQTDLEAARARLRALELDVRNEVSLGLDELAAAREVAETYRTALVPQREEVVKRELERYNFMLGGVFELLQARRAEFDAYQEYLESVRDYWVSCARLRRAVGGQRVCSEQGAAPAIGVDEILKPRQEMQHMDHSSMDHSNMDHSTMKHDTPPDTAPPPADNGGGPAHDGAHHHEPETQPHRHDQAGEQP